MNRIKRVLVGMSGGVDSSVAALLLKQAGYEVVGVTMRITPDEVASSFRKLACYGEDEAAEIQDVERVARHLGIEYRVVDLRREYEERILNYFRQEYARGRTPNPCVKCNAEIKFGMLLEGCRKLGLEYDYFATGHYARVTYDERSGRWLLLKARDETKDQSYFLALLSQEQLSRSLFPLGELRKSEVRRIAREHQLPVSEKEESQDFYAGDYRELLPKGKPGPIKDLSGKVLGQHEGIENYTVGQRRGLGIASGGRLYVVKIDAASNTVYVGEEKDLLTSVFFVDGLNWITRIPGAGEEIEATVKVRYKSPELACRLIAEFPAGAAGREMAIDKSSSQSGEELSDASQAAAKFHEQEPEQEGSRGRAAAPSVRAEPAGSEGQRSGLLEDDGRRNEKAQEAKSSGQSSRAGRQTSDYGAGLVPRTARVVLLTPYKAITPGQVAVFYEGETVLGAGFIR
ncbi:MAG: tRNA 2-thiouridine(34) synthase MnmA [Candidatus Saccharicenans sp.]|nr:tRNA 2-thiouridine(34) synthase MnmA [Candidatus Saccharicenans sp.]